MTMGEKIMRLRKARGWSQEELAEQIGVTRQAISRWESDSAKPDADNIIALCNLFGISADYLLGTESKTETVTIGTSAPAAEKPGIQRLIIGIVFVVLGTLMLFALALISSLDPWAYSDGKHTYDGIAGYVLSHDLQWLVVCIALLFFGGFAMLVWKYLVDFCSMIMEWGEKST